MKKHFATFILFFVAFTSGFAGQIGWCFSQGPQEETIDELREKYDVVVIARRLNETESNSDANGNWATAEFQLLNNLKKDDAKTSTTFTAPCRNADRGREIFLLAGVHSKTDSTDGESAIRWKIVKPISVAFRHHAVDIAELQATEFDRLKFYRDFLMDSDSDISSNATTQLMIASDELFAKVSKGMNREPLRKRLENSKLPNYLHSLYLAMLSHCGNQADAKWLQTQIIERSNSLGLEAWIGCYLALAGQDGLPFVNRQLLNTPEPSFRDRYAALLALRYVRDQHPACLPQEALLQSFHQFLDDDQLADLMIMDLAHMKDWESLDRLVVMFQNPETEWVRRPIVNFVRICPLAEATKAMEKLKRFDAATAKRAKQFWTDKALLKKPRPSRIRIVFRRDSRFRC